jgi:hypothetical protein
MNWKPLPTITHHGHGHGNNFALGLLPDLGYPSMIHIMIGSINEGTNRHSHMNRLSFEKGRK